MNPTQIKPSALQFIAQFRRLDSTDRQQVLQLLNQEDWEREWDQLDAELPDLEMSMEDIVAETKASRREPNRKKAA